MDIISSLSENTYGGDLDSTDDPGPDSPSSVIQQTGGAFINAGTYGCAFAPPLKCANASKDPPKPSESIGKVFSARTSFNKELEEIKKIKQFDPKYEFTVPYIKNCDINKRDIQPSDQADKCDRHITQSKQVYPQLIYKYGGIDLANVYEKPLQYPIALDDLIRLALPVFKGIQRMGVMEYAHVDIKPPNVLLDITASPNKMYLIDFGILTKFKDLKSQFYLHHHRYPYYPPEFRIYDCQRKGIYGIRPVLQLCMDNFAYFNSALFLQWITKRWPNYIGQLQRTIQFFQSIKFHEFMRDFDAEIAPKVDTYGIGMSLLELVYRFEVFNPHYLKITNKAFYEDCINKLLFPMINPDVYSRIPIDEAIYILEELTKTYPKQTRPFHPSPKKKDKKTKQPPVEITPSRTPSPASPTKPTQMTMEQCLAYKLVELREFMEHHNLPKYGTKKELCTRLIEASNKQFEEHKSAKKILKKVAKRDKSRKGYYQELVPPPENEIQREIDRLYIKPLLQCNSSENKGGYSITELRAIAQQLRLKHAKKREEICKELEALRITKKK